MQLCGHYYYHSSVGQGVIVCMNVTARALVTVLCYLCVLKCLFIIIIIIIKW